MKILILISVVLLKELYIASGLKNLQLDNRRWTGKPRFTNTFAIKVNGGLNAINDITRKYGFIYLGPIGDLSGYYVLLHPKVKAISKRRDQRLYNILSNESKVAWFKQQEIRSTELRAVDTDNSRNENNIEDEDQSLKYKNIDFNDPLYKDQWYILKGGAGGYDMDVINVWRQGYTGKGIVVTILDDGVQSNHPDLSRNYDSKASVDLLHGITNHPLPNRIPFKHGTHCAGTVFKPI